MKYLIPIIIGIVLTQMVSALAATQSVSRQTAEVEVQYTETGADYKHGSWCMDGRVF